MEAQLMVGDQVTRGLHHGLGPALHITEAEFHDLAACFTDNMVVMIFAFTESVFAI
jgi:hypothetical protein